MVSALSPSLDTALASSAAPQEKKATYLERAVEWLKPETAAAHERNQTLWMVAAYATPVAFTALAAAGLVCTFVFVPSYVYLVPLAALCLLRPVTQLFEKFQAFSEQEGALAEEARQRAQIHAQMPSGEALGRKLEEMGVHFENMRFKSPDEISPASLQRLSPIIAEYGYWDKLLAKKQEEYDTLVKKAETLSKEPNRNQTHVNEARFAAVAVGDAWAQIAVRRAFAYAMLHRPDFPGKEEDLFSVSIPPLEERSLNAEFGEGDVFLRFLGSEKESEEETDEPKISQDLSLRAIRFYTRDFLPLLGPRIIKAVDAWQKRQVSGQSSATIAS